MSYLRNNLRLSASIACILALLTPAVGHGEVVIVSPANGAVVDPTFTVMITYTDQYFGDTDVEDYIEPDEFEIRADGMVVVSCAAECQNSNTAEFQLMLLPGPHELEAMARVSFGFSEEVSEPITVTVKAESDTTGDTDTTAGTDTTADTPTSGGAPTSGTDATGTTAQPPPGSDDKAGCACDAGPGPGSALPWLVAAGLPLRRRRARPIRAV